MSIKPLKNKVAVKYFEEEEKDKRWHSTSRYSKREKPQMGEIVAVGSECCNEDGEAYVKVGDKVVFDKYAGTKVNIDETEYIILSIDDVLAVIE